MPITAEFPGMSFKDSVTGYRVSAAFSPGIGFQANFYVYVWVSVDATHQPGDVDLGDKGSPKRGKLQLSGAAGINHSFPDIDLINVQMGATHMERFRMLEFQYSDRVTDAGDRTIPDLSYNWNREVAHGRLGDDYVYNLGDGKEELLGFVVRRSATEGTSMRFTSYANGRNSWLKKIFEASKKKDGFEMTVELGKESIKANKNNLTRLFVDESYGELLRYPQPSLTSLTSDNSGKRARMDLEGYSLEALSHHLGRTFERTASDDVLESATLVFQPAFYRTLAVK